MNDSVIQQLMTQIAAWLQSVALTFVDSIALFLPPMFHSPGLGTTQATLSQNGIGVSNPDPLYTSYFSLDPSSTISQALTFSTATVQVLILLKITIDAMRLYMARDAGEQILSPTVFLRRSTITVIFALACGAMINILGSLTGGVVTTIREALYADFHGPAGSTAVDEFSYPNIRQWVRDMACWLTLPNNQADGLLRMPQTSRPPQGVPCVGAMAGIGEATLHWLPPDPWQTYGYGDAIGNYNDQRDYWIYRSTVNKARPVPSEQIDVVPVLTEYTDRGLTNGQQYYYWVSTWCWRCNQEIFTGPLPVFPDDRLLPRTEVPPGRALLNIMMAVSLGVGAIAIVLQTAFRSVEIIFAKLVGPFMALSAMNTDHPWSEGAMSLWLREVAVLVLSQIIQVIVLCLLVSAVPTTPPFTTGLGTFVRPSGNTLRFGDVVLAFVLITIGTQGPRVLRNFIWSGDGVRSLTPSSQVIGRIASKLPW